MTLPDERYRSLAQTREFLIQLMSSKDTPRVPKIIRQRARGLLRHWPDTYHLHLICEALPDQFAERMEPVYRMIKQYEQSKAEQNEN